MTDKPQPIGVWDDAGYWHPDPASLLLPSEQKTENEANGYACTLRPSSSTGAFDADA